MSTEPPVSEDDRRLIVRVREYLAWYDTQPASPWVVECIGLMNGTIRRKWHPNPRFMEPGEPIGEWRSETVPGVSRGRGSSLGGSSLPSTSDGTAAAGRYTVHSGPRADAEGS